MRPKLDARTTTRGKVVRRGLEARIWQLLLFLPPILRASFSMHQMVSRDSKHHSSFQYSMEKETLVIDRTVSDFVRSVEEVDNITTSLRVLLGAAAFRHKEDDRFQSSDPLVEEARCQRYGFELDTSKPLHRRRTFWGSLIADDSWHALGIAAMEYHGLIDTIVFVESNTTQTLAPRTMRFSHNSSRKKVLTSPLLWGEQTRVHVDYYLKENSNFGNHGLWRENDQRDVIIQRWKENGMTEQDVGLISDVDEVVTRDFLQALRTCKIPELLPTFKENRTLGHPAGAVIEHYDCLEPKILANTLVYEGSPLCRPPSIRWHHPDFIVGGCIEGIGDASLRRTPTPREVAPFGAYTRLSDWRSKLKNVTLPGSTDTVVLGPLWDANDFRMEAGGRQILGRTKTGFEIPTAYHFHNFFDSIAMLRRKYVNYGHNVPKAMDLPLSQIHEDLGFMVDCLENYSSRQRAGQADWYNLDPVHISPIAFQKVPAYVRMRHEELQVELASDDRLHSSKFGD